MNIPPELNEQNLSELLCFKDEDGRAFLRIGLLVTVFFDNQLTRSVRETVAEVVDEYVELVRPHLRWAIRPGARKFTPFTSKRIKLAHEFLPQHPDGEWWSFRIHGGDTAMSASEFHVDGFGSPPLDDGGLGFLHLSFPLLWFANRAETFPEYVVRVCRRLRPLSGYGGIGVLEISNGYEAELFLESVRVLAERFPGLEVEDRVTHTLHLREGIKGVNWLTILGERWVNEMGGIEPLRARLGEPFGFYPYEGGLVIQAGPKPQIGDVEANNWPEHYIKLAKVLKKIQITFHSAFHYDKPGQRRLDLEASQAWLFRFDNK